MRKDPKGNPLPPRLHWKHGRYWYVFRNRWEPLSANYSEAMGRYGRLVAPGRGMDALIDRVMAQVETEVSASTLRAYLFAAERIKEAFAEFDPSEVTQGHIAQYHDALSSTPNMANRHLQILRVVFDRAARWGMVPYNPAIGLKRHRESKRTRYVTDAEFAAIRAQARPWMALLMDVLYLTGQRVGDVLAIKRSDITDEGIAFEQQKTGKRLVVAMSGELASVVKEAKTVHGSFATPYLFHPRGQKGPYSYNTAHDAYYTACRAAGITDTTLHDLRAKSLTDANQAGLDATALAGHTSPSMTARYIRLRQIKTVSGPQFLRQSMDKG